MGKANGQSRKNRWIYWIKLLVGIMLIAMLYKEVNREQSVIDAFRHVNWWHITFCFILLIPNIFLAFAKWRYLLKNRFSDISDKEAIGSLLFGYTLGLVTPGRLGELGRGLFFQNKDRLTITGLNILDKATNQIIFFTTGTIALMLMAFTRNIWQLQNIIPLMIGGGVFILLLWVVILNPTSVKVILAKLSARRPPNSKIRALITAFDNFTFKDSIRILGLSFLWIMVIALQYHVLVLAFTDVYFWESLQAVTATLFVKTLLPFTFGDLGIREGIAIFFYSQFQVSSVAVFNASLLIFFINFLLPALSGIVYLLPIRARQALLPRDNAEEEPLHEKIAYPGYVYSSSAVKSGLKDD